jgi:hypothetical protein
MRRAVRHRPVQSKPKPLANGLLACLPERRTPRSRVHDRRHTSTIYDSCDPRAGGHCALERHRIGRDVVGWIGIAAASPPQGLSKPGCCACAAPAFNPNSTASAAKVI